MKKSGEKYYMRKKSILIFIISLLVIMLASCMLKSEPRTEYVLPSNISLAFFGTEPEDFFTTNRKLYDYCEDFRKYAEIDENGDLVLKLTSAQEKATLEYYDSGLEEFDKIPEVEVLDDYTGFTITGDKEAIIDIVANEFGILTIDELAFRQLFNGTKPEDISVKVTIIEQGSNNILYTATWPKEDITLSPKAWQFSE